MTRVLRGKKQDGTICDILLGGKIQTTSGSLVFNANDIDTHTPLVIKVAQGNDDFDYWREFKALLKTNEDPSGHLPSTYAIAENGYEWFALPHYGQTVDKIFEPGNIPQEQLLSLIHGIFNAVMHQHTHGITHNDLKPGNIALPEGEVMLLDFGYATFVGSPPHKEFCAVGSPVYMAPEWVAQEPMLYETELLPGKFQELLGMPHFHPGPQSDMYSLATVIYYFATGTFPLPLDEDPNQVLRYRLTHEPAQLEHGLLPQDVTNLLNRTLQPDPHDRATSDEFIHATLPT